MSVFLKSAKLQSVYLRNAVFTKTNVYKIDVYKINACKIDAYKIINASNRRNLSNKPFVDANSQGNLQNLQSNLKNNENTQNANTQNANTQNENTQNANLQNVDNVIPKIIPEIVTEINTNQEKKLGISNKISDTISKLKPKQNVVAKIKTKPLEDLSTPACSQHHQPTFDENKVYIPWEQGGTSAFHNIWLRDNCQCDFCVDPITKQKLLDSSRIPEGIIPENLICKDKDCLEIIWKNDGHKSIYPWDWLHIHSYAPVFNKPEVIVHNEWGKEINENPPIVDYDFIMSSESGVAEWTKKIVQYGFCFVDQVPENPIDTENLCKRISYILPTHYGAFYDFTSDMSLNDSAYSNLSLEVHTDGTYFTNTPGIQIFHLLKQAEVGGETLLVDGFKCAKLLREEYPEAYSILSRIRVPAHCSGNNDICITQDIPTQILRHNPLTGQLQQIRWNSLDRSPIVYWDNADDDVPKFYKAIKSWYNIIRRQNLIYKFNLKPGRLLAIDNWRVLHGRTEFTGERRMCGAYINRDDFFSRYNLTNKGRSILLKSL